MRRPMQLQVLNLIKREVAAGRPFPSASRVAAEFGWCYSGARDAIERLVVNGHVARSPAPPNTRGRRYVYSVIRNTDP